MGYLRDLIQGTPARSPHWPKARAEHLKRQPACAACGGTSKLEVHHIIPFSSPHGRDHELDPLNLLTLCEAGPNCHLTFGHLRDWKKCNPMVVKDSALYLSRLQQYRYPPASSPPPAPPAK